jgi:hypothetical protein
MQQYINNKARLKRAFLLKALLILFEAFCNYPFRYSFGLIPFRREKNLLKEGVSAK